MQSAIVARRVLDVFAELAETPLSSFTEKTRLDSKTLDMAEEDDRVELRALLELEFETTFSEESWAKISADTVETAILHIQEHLLAIA